jgi:hypothetical protein
MEKLFMLIIILLLFASGCKKENKKDELVHTIALGKLVTKGAILDSSLIKEVQYIPIE